MRAYFDKNKKELFPKVKDWSADPMTHIIDFGSISKMPYKYWIFFHPSAYNLITYSYKICTILFFGGAAVLSGLWKIWILAAILGFIAIYQIIPLFNQIKNHKYFKSYTFYDLWMRE